MIVGMQKWQYRSARLSLFDYRRGEHVSIDPEQISAYLNEMGADGWELVSVAPSGGDFAPHWFHFKRSIQ